MSWLPLGLPVASVKLSVGCWSSEPWLRNAPTTVLVMEWWS